MKDEMGSPETRPVVPEGARESGAGNFFAERIFEVKTEEEARRFFEGEVAYCRTQVTASIMHTPEDLARRNIGWCFSEGMDSERVQMWAKVCGVSHPLFGANNLSLQITGQDTEGTTGAKG